MRKQSGYTLVELLLVIVLLIGAGGWIVNIVRLAHSDFDNISGKTVIRCIGVPIAPLGAVMGFIK